MNTRPSLSSRPATKMPWVVASASWLLAALLPGLPTGANAQAVAAFTNLRSFGSSSGSQSALVPDGSGNFFGASTLGGSSETGTLFKVTAAGGGTVLQSFGVGQDSKDGSPGGIYPKGNVIVVDGSIYGEASAGGEHSTGTIFEYYLNNALPDLVHTFSADSGSGNNDGAEPSGGLIVGLNGAFYGTTEQGGSFNGGTVFQARDFGSFTTLYAFGHPGSNEGTTPLGGVIQTSDGYFYGTAQTGGLNGAGTIFQLTPQHVLHTLYNFAALNADDTNADGANPAAGLFHGTDNFLYGTTASGGHGTGTVFKITTNGDLTTLHLFDALNGAINSDGAYPQAALIEGADGNYYGTTALGGANGAGTIFQITPAGVFSTIYTFTAVNAQNVNADGAQPHAALTASTGGTFYGTTFTGGANGRGAFFMISMLPVATNAATAVGGVGAPFSFALTATNSPTSFTVDNVGGGGLPPGLSLDAATGLLTGTPTQAGTYPVSVFISNVFGASTATVQVTIVAPPVITSAVSATGEVGVPFNYQITATNSPTAYSATGLPAGLSLDTATGILSGAPTAFGTFPIALTATNGGGAGTAVLTLVVASNPALTPVVTIVVLGDGEAVKGVSKGKAAVQRTGDTSAALTVLYTVKGSAQAGVDYEMLGGTVTIPAGAAQVKIKVKPIDNGIPDGTLVVKIKLLPATDGTYTLGTGVTGKIRIASPD